MKKMIWFTTLSVLFAVLILPGILALGIKYVPYDVQPPLEGVKEIYGEITVSQEFISQESDLTGIATTIKNPNLRSKKDFYLNLYDDNKELLRQVKFNGANVEDGSYIKFLFDPIADSKGKKYVIMFTNQFASDEEVLGIYYTSRKPSWIGKMLFEKEEHEGGVSIVTFHKSQGKLGVVKKIYLSWLSRLL